MTTNMTHHGIVAKAIDKLCEVYIEDIRDYYGDDVSCVDITPLDIVRDITVAIRASITGELYLVFQLYHSMSSMSLEAHIIDNALVGDTIIACQEELTRYQRIAGATAHG